MSAETILDAVATKAGTITGIKRAYGSGQTSAVPAMPEDIPDGPVCVVTYEGFSVGMTGSFERVTHRFAARVYVSKTDVGPAYKELMRYPERFIVAFRTDADLGGTCAYARVTGGGRPEDVEVNGKPFLVLPVMVEADEARGATYSV